MAPGQDTSPAGEERNDDPQLTRARHPAGPALPAAGKAVPPAAGSTGGTRPLVGIALKLLSVTSFVIMVTVIKMTGSAMPTGEIVFFRSAFALVPVFIYLAMRGQMAIAWRTSRPILHLVRGLVGVSAMGLSFYGIAQLPLPDAIAIGYAMPLLTVVFAAIFLGESVRVFRWTAVAIGLTGVLVISWPRLTLFEAGLGSTGEALGVIALLLSATFGASAAMLVRRLTVTEKTPTIVLYFSLSAAILALFTFPFGWVMPDLYIFSLMLIAGICGGLAQIFLTQSYRHADVSTIAPFEYASILFGLAIGYLLFDEVPTASMLIGTAIVVAAGIFIILREHRLGLERRAQRRLVGPQG
ncbi:DMT family transporter [Pseudohoeflea coraliihabitans]|uniref:DMT family transporter n=1 Tax=Pseudohoeflea coraliihabitans TaxID=2860393 RepID=A0ABS6WSS1_9HYPH|nr:DMT family transporter [Pseudohoeflea sp. DP4N28-3]MBW3098688.1 DMT family transporter [Pseudohoeflea sp. DP4N28-3]